MYNNCSKMLFFWFTIRQTRGTLYTDAKFYTYLYVCKVWDHWGVAPKLIMQKILSEMLSGIFQNVYVHIVNVEIFAGLNICGFSPIKFIMGVLSQCLGQQCLLFNYSQVFTGKVSRYSLQKFSPANLSPFTILCSCSSLSMCYAPVWTKLFIRVF